MARFRSGNAIQSKIQMILFGNPFTGKSTMALQSAYLKNPDGSPFKVLYLDPESGSVDDYLPTLAENGVDMRNMWQRKQAYLNRVYEYNKQKGNCMDSIQRISYDLAILLSRYDGYLEWKEKQSLLGEQQQESANVIYENIIPRVNKPNRHKGDVSIADVLDEI